MQKKNETYKTRLFFFALLCALTACGPRKITTTNLDANKLPAGIKFSGKIKNAVRWTDKLGDNIVITTETGETASNKEEPTDNFRDAALYAYHYIVREDSAILTWKVYDFIQNCPVEIEANFIEKTFQVTDLNKDGIAEIWLMYKTACHGDVSPCDMKIIMYQGQQKFAMRGQNKVHVSDKEFNGGDYTYDKAFADGPKEFLAFAKKLWDKNIMQTWGETSIAPAGRNVNSPNGAKRQ